MKILFSSLLLFLISTVAIAVDPRAAYDMVIEGKAVMVDVREKVEVEEGMVDVAVWFPKSTIDNDPNWLEDFLILTEGKEIFLYCRSGRRSEEVRKILEINGIQSVNIGGYNQLKDILPTAIPKF